MKRYFYQIRRRDQEWPVLGLQEFIGYGYTPFYGFDTEEKAEEAMEQVVNMCNRGDYRTILGEPMKNPYAVEGRIITVTVEVNKQ